jgi:hypothetical protein
MKLYLLIAISVFISATAQAQSNLYGTFALGLAQNEIENYELDQFSYKVGIGYQLTPQWDLEASFQGLGAENAGDTPQSNFDVSEFYGVSVSALGKARGEYGYLYYRLGVMMVDAQVQTIGSLVCIPDPLTPGLCTIDESVMAGVLGLGFDLLIFQNAMVRFEVEHIQGQEDYSANAAYIGVRLNF